MPNLPNLPHTRRSFLHGATAVTAVTATASLTAATSPAAADSQATACPIARDGTPTGHLVWWSDTRDSPARFAATELARYLHTMTGHPVTVRRQSRPSSGPEHGVAHVADGTPPSRALATAATAHASLAGAAHDAFLITPRADHTTLTGKGARAPLYAAYELLRRLGVRFFAPAFSYYAGAAETVPRRRDLTVAGTTVRQVPTWPLRRKYVEEGWSLSTDRLLRVVDWMAKQKLDVLVFPYDYYGVGATRYDDFRADLAPELARRGLRLEVGGHGYESFLPKDDYPQFYTSGTSVFDVHNDKAVRQYVHNVTAYLKKRPEIDIFDCWPPDGADWPDKALKQYGSATNAEAHVVNALVAALRKDVPDVRVERIAYAASLEPPTDGHAFDSDVIVDFAAYDRSYAVPIDDPSSQTNAHDLALLRRWRDAHSGTLAVYDYSRRYRWRQLPANVLPVLAADAAAYQKIGVDGVGSYAEPGTWLAAEAVHLFAAQSAWQPTRTSRAFLDDYLTARFGKAASTMARYFQHTTADPDGLEKHPKAFQRKYTAARDAVHAARGQTPRRSAAATVLRRLDQAADLSLADVAIARAKQDDDAAAEKRAAEHYRAGTLRHRFDGIQLESSYVSKRYDEQVERTDIAELYRAPAWGYLTPNGAEPHAGDSLDLRVTAQDVDYQGHRVRWRLHTPPGVTANQTSGTLTADGEHDASHTVRLHTTAGLAAGKHTVTVRLSLDGEELTTLSCTLTVTDDG